MLQDSSSGLYRQALSKSDLISARKISGIDYCLKGKVVHGNHLGKSLGFPTANLLPDSDYPVLLGHGVYVVKVFLDQEEFFGICNIGMRPTIGGINTVVEVNIFEFDRDIYGRSLKICFLELLREERKFSDLDQLAFQISQDKIRAMNYLSRI